jgi:Domain of unknown function (DUF4124)
VKSLAWLLVFVPCLTLGGVYQWTDENGLVHFGSVPPQQQDEYSLGDNIKSAPKKAVRKKPVQVEKKEPQTNQSTTPAIQTEKGSPVQRGAAAQRPSKQELKALILKLRQGAGKMNPQETKVNVGTQKMPTKPAVEKVATPAVAEMINHPVDKKTESPDDAPPLVGNTRLKTEKDADKCGFFMGFVEEYKIKKDEGCPGPSCEIYERQYKKFRLKQERYC